MTDQPHLIVSPYSLLLWHFLLQAGAMTMYLAEAATAPPEPFGLSFLRFFCGQEHIGDPGILCIVLGGGGWPGPDGASRLVTEPSPESLDRLRHMNREFWRRVLLL